MPKPYMLGYVTVIALIVVGLLSLSGGHSQAAPLAGFTDTPTPTPTNTTTATPTNTPTNTPTETPAGPDVTVTPVPGVDVTPQVTATPEALTPVGPFTLPLTGNFDLTPILLLLVAAGGLLVLGVRLGWHSTRQS